MMWWTRPSAPGTCARDDDQRDDADRHVDVEDPAPGELLDEDAAEQRADDARHAEHRAEQALVAAALAGRDDVADDRLGADHQPAAAEALDGAEGDQLDHGVAEPRQDRADQEDHDGGLEEDLPAVLVAELAPQRRRHRRGEQVGGDDPGDVRRAREVGDDRRQRGRDDRLVERRQQHPEHQRADDDQDRPVAEPRQRAVVTTGSAAIAGSAVTAGSAAVRRDCGRNGCVVLGHELCFLSDVATTLRKEQSSGSPAASASQARSASWSSASAPPALAQKPIVARITPVATAASNAG